MGILVELVLVFLLSGLPGLGIERSRGVLRDVYLVLIAAVGLFVFRQDEGYFIAVFLSCGIGLTVSWFDADRSSESDSSKLGASRHHHVRSIGRVRIRKLGRTEVTRRTRL